jgi:hypothetical protein
MPFNNPKQLTFPFAQQQQQPLFGQTLPFKRSYYKTLSKGALCAFNYSFWKHDPSPLVIVTDVWGDRIRGVNLHYLTYRYMKGILANYCGKAFFSYRFIVADPFIVSAFRTYKKSGLTQLKILDCGILNNVLTQVRSFNPQELNYIKQSIQQQLQTQLNPTAEQMAQQYQQEMISPQPQKGFMPLVKDQRQDARRAFRASVPSPIIPPPLT